MLARRRLHVLDKHLSLARRGLSAQASSGGVRIDLGSGVHVVKRLPRNPELVPRGYLGNLSQFSEETLNHLRWMAQKDRLGQDCFLLGGPGPVRRWLALSYCELAGREVDFMTLSRDTTESDLKQRREILHANALFVDQAPVRAALHGRVLIIEGIERVERNVLPTLNNLLEDRSMALEDGRFIMKSSGYMQLLAAGHSEADLRTRGLLPCHPDFRVLALGVPVPPYKGRTLDPPLRSRFQCRAVDSSLSGDPLGASTVTGPLPRAPSLPAPPPSAIPSSSDPCPQNFSLDRPAPAVDPQIVTFVETLRQLRAGAGGGGQGVGANFPIFPVWNLPHLNDLLVRFPGCGRGQVLARTYPYMYAASSPLSYERQEPLQQQLRPSSPSRPRRSKGSRTREGENNNKGGLMGLAGRLGVDNMSVGPLFEAVEAMATHEEPSKGLCARRRVRLQFEGGIEATAEAGELAPSNAPLSLYAPGGGVAGKEEGKERKEYFVETPTTRAILTGMLQEHALGRDVCLLGEKGVGKSRLAQLFGHRLGYVPEVFPLFRDLTPRDLLQRRGTDGEGNTRWEDSPLVRAAKEGKLVILDGIHRLHADTLVSLQRLVLDREVELYDRTRLVLGAGEGGDGRGRGGKPGLSDGGLRVLPLHPSFRIVALGQTDPSPLSSASALSVPWLQHEIVPLFSWLSLPPLTASEHDHLLHEAFPSLPPSLRHALLEIEAGFGNRETEGEQVSLSTRQLVRLARALVAVVGEGGPEREERARATLPVLMHETLMTAFATGQVREVVEDVLQRAGLSMPSKGCRRTPDSKSNGSPSALTIETTPDTVRIGDVSAPRCRAQQRELVPNPTPFFDNPRHVQLLQRLLVDWIAGEKAILLVGNQGVGKNKLVDRLLQLLDAEREYIQLHRDTTLHSLTLVPALIDGRITYEDSPLIRAVEQGRVLVVDEADKAPAEVVLVLKGLLEDGYLLLPDGRKVMAGTDREGGIASVGEGTSARQKKGEKAVIPIHPDFRMIVLANRPGYPFLGNDFFATVGDVFACHAIENADVDSEEQLLAAYAPSLPPSLHRRLALCFADLRELYLEGVILYPYSVREAVAVVRHLEAFPQDGVGAALNNVLDFDVFSQEETREILAQVFQSRGIPLTSGLVVEGRSGSSEEGKIPPVEVASPQPLPPVEVVGSWKEERGERGKGVDLWAEVVQGRAWQLPASVWGSYEVETSRLSRFSEEVARVNVGKWVRGRGGGGGGEGASLSMAATMGMGSGGETDLHVLASDPFRLLSFYDLGGGGSGSRALRRLELFPGPWGSMLDDTPYVFPVPCPSAVPSQGDSGEGGGDWVGVVFPRKRYVLLLPASGALSEGEAQRLDLPRPGSASPATALSPALAAWGGSTASAWRDMLGGRGDVGGGRVAEGIRGGVQLVAESTGSRRLIYYTPGEASLSVMDLEGGTGKGGGAKKGRGVTGRITHIQLRDPWTGDDINLRHVGVAPSGELVLWCQGGREEGGGGGEAVFTLEGLRLDLSNAEGSTGGVMHSDKGEFCFKNEADPMAALRLKKIRVSGVPVSEAFVEQGRVLSPTSLSLPSFLAPSDSSSFSPSFAFFTTAPGAYFQAIGPWCLEEMKTEEERSVFMVPRGMRGGDTGHGRVMRVVQEHPRALKRLDHLVSVLSSPSSSETSSFSPLSPGCTGSEGTSDKVVLEVIDPCARTLRSIVLHSHPPPSFASVSPLRGRPPRPLRALGMLQVGKAGGEGGTGRVALLLNDETLRLVEVEEEALGRQQREWKMMFPGGVAGREEMLRQRAMEEEERNKGKRERWEKEGVSVPKTGLDRPKHGKEDAKNEPHVGGNTWAGGSGGSDTAGLGGRGGPYRLDKGHRVHQVSEAMKQQVTESARKEAARMGREALKARLREIGMAEGEWKAYDGIRERVEGSVRQLREILEGLRSRGKEREWVRNQAQGELDDAKLVDGLAGERLVFRRRVEAAEAEEGGGRKAEKEKRGRRRMLFVMDASGSMYRFNGKDGRLDRMLEVACMLMEAFEGQAGEEGGGEVEYAIWAHSGDAPRLPLVEFGRPPRTRKEKLAVLERIAAHAQYCQAGDHTLRATEEAAAELSAYQQARDGGEEEGEGQGRGGGSYLFVVSDANFARYGIDPRRLGEALVRDRSVRGHVFLVASLGDEAAAAVRAMPVGRAHLCLDAAALPGAMKRIFVEELKGSMG